jgi:pleiotropic regulator 1
VPYAPGAAGAGPISARAIQEVLRDKGHSSAAVSRRLGSKWPRPVWHPPWKNYRVISGHLG